MTDFLGSLKVKYIEFGYVRVDCWRPTASSQALVSQAWPRVAGVIDSRGYAISTANADIALNF
jgi:hypothetical protein